MFVVNYSCPHQVFFIFTYFSHVARIIVTCGWVLACTSFHFGKDFPLRILYHSIVLSLWNRTIILQLPQHKNSKSYVFFINK